MQRHMQIQAKSSLTKKEWLENWSLAKNDFDGQVPPLKSPKNREISQQSFPAADACRGFHLDILKVIFHMEIKNKRRKTGHANSSSPENKAEIEVLLDLLHSRFGWNVQVQSP